MIRPFVAIVIVCVGLLVATVGLATPPPVADPAIGDAEVGAEDAGDPGAQARRLLQRGGYQVGLPLDRQSSSTTIPRPLADLLLWLSLAVVLIVGAMLLARELGFGDRGSMRASGAADEAELLEPSRVRGDPDRLAAEGRFDEAVHVLLLVAIRRLSTETGVEPRASSTARELIAAFPLDRERRLSFTGLVRTVEWSLFGGRPVSADDYGRCRDTFRALVRP